MSMWADYQEERLGFKTIEADGGFITYDLKPPECSIEEFYVKPELRGTRLARDLADQVFGIAKSAGCTKMYARVFPGITGCDHVMKTNLHYGFKLSHILGGAIILVKDIEQGDV